MKLVFLLGLAGEIENVSLTTGPGAAKEVLSESGVQSWVSLPGADSRRSWGQLVVV